MTFTYTGACITDLEKLRRMIGDIKVDDPLMTDEELAPILADNVNDLITAAAEACEEIAAGFARDAVSYVGDMNNSPALKVDNYLKMARAFYKRLQSQSKKARGKRPGWSAAARARTSIFTRDTCSELEEDSTP